VGGWLHPCPVAGVGRPRTGGGRGGLGGARPPLSDGASARHRWGGGSRRPRWPALAAHEPVVAAAGKPARRHGCPTALVLANGGGGGRAVLATRERCEVPGAGRNTVGWRCHLGAARGVGDARVSFQRAEDAAAQPRPA